MNFLYLVSFIKKRWPELAQDRTSVKSARIWAAHRLKQIMLPVSIASLLHVIQRYHHRTFNAHWCAVASADAREVYLFVWGIGRKWDETTRVISWLSVWPPSNPQFPAAFHRTTAFHWRLYTLFVLSIDIKKLSRNLLNVFFIHKKSYN
jgi:hypothetical protein